MRFWSSLVDVAGRSDWQSPLYLAFAPLALLRPGSRRLVLALGGYAAYLFLTWWLLTHRLDRFWLPLLPCLAILAGLGADWSEDWSWRILRGTILAVALVCNFIDCTTALTGLNEWTANLAFLRRDVPAGSTPRWPRSTGSCPPTRRSCWSARRRSSTSTTPILYNTVFNPETIELLAAGKNPRGVPCRAQASGASPTSTSTGKRSSRHRDPAGYGFTDFVTPERFAAWIEAGVLDRPVPIALEDHPGRIALEQELYPVR